MKTYYNPKLDKFVSRDEYFKAVFNGVFTDSNTSVPINKYNLLKLRYETNR